MTSNDEKLEALFSYLNQLDHVDPAQIPSIDLYMDQVLTFMNTRLAGTRQDPNEVVITKTMINNYAKNHLLPPPVKKRYSRDHILMLILIYYYKNVITFQDIEVLFAPVSEKYFQHENALADLYRRIFLLEEEEREALHQDVRRKFARARESFPDGSSDSAFLQLFAFISELAFDVYIKKEMIEMLTGMMAAESAADAQKAAGAKKLRKDKK